jgi:Rad3-related DNA helicase
MSYRSPEQGRYAHMIEAALRPGPPLLAGAAAGLGKTHGYSTPLVRSGLRVAIAMSTRQLIDQYLTSDALQAATQSHGVKVIALLTRRHFDKEADYQAHREQALAAQVLLITHAAALIDSIQPGYAQLRQRDVILFDEADLLADAADLRSTFRINTETLKACNAQGLSAAAAVEQVRLHAPTPEDRCAATAIRHALDHPAPYKVVGFGEDGTLSLRHRMPGRMLKPLIKDTPRCIFTSGTLQVSERFDHFVQAMGLEAIAPESRHIDPAHHGALTVVQAANELSHDDMAARIAAAERPTLVLTSSHAMTQVLGSRLPMATVRGPDESLADAVQRCPNDGLLIAAGAWSGLDAPRLRWRTVVIPQTPYGQPVSIEGQQVTRYIDSQVVALRRTNQGLHRGLRTPDAQCTLLLLDPRSARDALRQAIPERFRANQEFFEEGSLVLQTHFKRERKVALRAAALKLYGAHCMAPGCDITALHLLEVHHTRPIAQGERRTTLDEVVVLCKNHHADAHHELKISNFLAVEITKSSAIKNT